MLRVLGWTQRERHASFSTDHCSDAAFSPFANFKVGLNYDSKELLVDPRVVALTGMFKGESYRLTGEKLTLGRDTSNSVQIGDATVSKKHCAIEAVQGQLRIS